MKKLFLLLVFLILIPVVYAAKEEEKCGILNIFTCFPKKLLEFFIGVLNAPLQPLLNLVKDLLTNPVKISLFSSLWATMIYVISIFYGILLLYSGFNFMVSGYDAARRENAKHWLKNILIMIILVQASYFLYEGALEVGAGLSAGIINLIPDNFFKLTADSFINIGLELIFVVPYVIILFLTVLLLLIRYAIVAVGVAFFPIGIFLYFIEPLKDYGKLVINALLSNIFVTFFATVILLAFSKLVDIGFLSNFKMLIMIGAFTMVIILMIFVMFFVVLKSAFKTSGKVVSVVSSIVKRI